MQVLKKIKSLQQQALLGKPATLLSPISPLYRPSQPTRASPHTPHAQTDMVNQIERARMSPRGGGVNRRFKTFMSGLTNAE
jgi:hypothetical protein